MKNRFTWIKSTYPRCARALQALSITLLALVALSGPAYATSAVLIPYLTIIQQVISDQLAKTVSEGFTKTAKNLINSQVEQYTKELAAKMMPGAFCESDIAQAAIGGVVARVTGYDEAKGIFAVTGADTVVNPTRAVGQLPSYNPNVVIQQHNREVRSYAQRAAKQNNNCSPVQASPVDATGSRLQCTQEERRIAAAVLVGASPPAELPDAAKAGALGEVYESARTSQIARKQLAALALSDASSWQKEQFIKGYRELLKKPSIEELNANSASGGVQRDAVVLQQLTAQLLLEEYVEKLEQKRLIATMVAQQADAEDREYLSKLRRR
jgi:hypothetical protein